MERRILIRDGVLPAIGAGATVVVEGRRIVRVAARGESVEPLPGDWDVDADGRLVIPGGIDAHSHLALGALERVAALPGRAPRGVADLRMALRDPLERKLTPARVEPLVRAAALAALRAGVTTVVDLVRGPPGETAAVLDAEARALRAIGLRAVIAQGARGERGGQRGGVDEVDAAAAFADRHAADRTLRGAVGLSGLAEASEELLEALAAPARRHPLVASVAEDEGDLAHAFARWSRRPVEVLAARGLLSPRAVVAHAGTVVHQEAVLLADAGAALAVTPRAAQYLGAPIPPLVPFAAMEVPVLLGTDGLFPDVAGEALAATLLHRHAERNAAAAPALVGRTTWPAAARLATGLFGEPLGRIEAGALADLVVLDWRPTAPLPEVPEGDLALLWAGAPAAWAIVDGEVRLREGRLLGADEAELAAAAAEAAGGLRG